MGVFEAQQEQQLELVSLVDSEAWEVNQLRAPLLEEWAAIFLLVQGLNKTAEGNRQAWFHDEPGRQPLVLPGRATIWPMELKSMGS